MVLFIYVDVFSIIPLLPSLKKKEAETYNHLKTLLSNSIPLKRRKPKGSVPAELNIYFLITESLE